MEKKLDTWRNKQTCVAALMSWKENQARSGAHISLYRTGSKLWIAGFPYSSCALSVREPSRHAMFVLFRTGRAASCFPPVRRSLCCPASAMFAVAPSLGGVFCAAASASATAAAAAAAATPPALSTAAASSSSRPLPDPARLEFLLHVASCCRCAGFVVSRWVNALWQLSPTLSPPALCMFWPQTNANKRSFAIVCHKFLTTIDTRTFS